MSAEKSEKRLLGYFTGTAPAAIAETVGAEVETSFLDEVGSPISREDSQQIFGRLAATSGWSVVATKGGLLTELRSPFGDKVLYELGRQNIEVSSVALPPQRLILHVVSILQVLYKAGRLSNAKPFFGPILNTAEDLLAIPDERDANWLTLDGRAALKPLARCSAVQFVVDVPPKKAVWLLNKLGEAIGKFLAVYPQDILWREYIRESRAGYDPLRYGGPLFFNDMSEYCRQLVRHPVVVGTQLVGHAQIEEFDIPLFLRSVWWYFRLRRYKDRLAIEVRPMPRKGDDELEKQLAFVLSLLEQ